MRKVTNPFDCRTFGRAVKEARVKSGLTRAEVAERYNIDARYLLEIENQGQHMSLQIFYELANLLRACNDFCCFGRPVLFFQHGAGENLTA